MRRVVVFTLAIAALLYISACAFMFFDQRSLIYYPTSKVIVPGASSFSLDTEGERLRIWNKEVDGSDAVIYFGGNAEEISTNLIGFERALPLHSIYLANYRGFGGSTGSPSEAALFNDALVVFDFVRKKHPNISVIGRSLGTGVAAYLAANRKVDKLVLVTPYDSIERIAKLNYPEFPVSLLLEDKFNSVERVQSINASTLVLLADNDEVIPRQNSEVLISKFPHGQVTTFVIRGTTHNSISLSPEYLVRLGEFLEKR